MKNFAAHYFFIQKFAEKVRKSRQQIWFETQFAHLSQFLLLHLSKKLRLPAILQVCSTVLTFCDIQSKMSKSETPRCFKCHCCTSASDPPQPWDLWWCWIWFDQPEQGRTLHCSPDCKHDKTITCHKIWDIWCSPLYKLHKVEPLQVGVEQISAF